MTSEHIDRCLVPQDSIALAGYNVDVHTGSGIVLQPSEHAIGIPYGCLVSRSVEGLLTSGRCISAEPYPLGLTRAMGTCFAIGEAAGTAAAMALASGVSLASLDPQALRRRLAQNGAIVGTAVGTAAV